MIAPDTNRELPFDRGCEMSTIASLLLGPAYIDECRAIITTPTMFWDERHQILYREIVQLYAETGNRFDTLQVHARLQLSGKLEKAGGYEYLKEVLHCLPSSAHWELYARKVRALAITRHGISLCHATMNELWADPEHAEEHLSQLHDSAGRLAQLSQESLGELAGPITTRIASDLMKPKTQQAAGGYRTGYDEIDGIIGGMRKKQLILLLGATKHGKSILGLNICANVAMSEEAPVAIFTYEMDRDEVGERLLFSVSGITKAQFLAGLGNRNERILYGEAQDLIDKSVLLIDDTCKPRVSAIRSRAKLYARKYGIKFICIDYYQLLEGEDKNDTRYDQLVQVSRSCKQLAQEIDMPVLLLAQTNNDPIRENRKPRMTDIEECKKAGKDANTVFILDRPFQSKKGDSKWEAENVGRFDHATLDIDARGGSSGGAELRFKGSILRFDPWHTSDPETKTEPTMF